jgi:lipoprotein-anchoring transpeptidase ErfK/SrfK
MSARRTLLAASIAAGAGLAVASGASAAPPTPSPPTAGSAWVARVLVPVTARRAPRMSARARAVVQPVAPFAKGPTVLLVRRTVVIDGRRWLDVLLPVRPNGTRGWIPADVVRLRRTTVRIVIDLSSRRLFLTRRGRRILNAPIAVGASGTPTPAGAFAVAEMVRTRTPGAFLGPIVFPLTGYSQTLNEFAGGNGRVAIHGTSLPELIGTRASHGCIRMLNKHIVRLSRIVRPGTPVVIRR